MIAQLDPIHTVREIVRLELKHVAFEPVDASAHPRSYCLESGTRSAGRKVRLACLQSVEFAFPGDVGMIGLTHPGARIDAARGKTDFDPNAACLAPSLQRFTLFAGF
ncbi:MAG TPA: hypothetical protein VEJ16_15910 [Alphaproteobacteria bacterium]|nr:hypothetical protein [Alphaproteobacteria bacterium]